MSLTPLQLNAAAGLLQNQGLCANTTQNSGYQIYLDCPLLAPLVDTINTGANNGSLSSSTITALQSLSPDCPALSNTTTPVQYVGNAPPIYTTLGVTSLVGRAIANIVQANDEVVSLVDIIDQEGTIETTAVSSIEDCILTLNNSVVSFGTVDTCANVTPNGQYVNLVDANAQSGYTSFDLLACFKQPVASNGNTYLPYLIGDFVTSDQWLGKCWVESPDYNAFANELLSLYLGQGDYTIFVQAYNLIKGYIRQSNNFIESSNIGTDYLSTTFDGMSNLVTGSVSSVNSNIKGFAEDLVNLGQLINLDDLESLGSPAALVAQIINVAGYLPVLSIAFLVVGIPQETVSDLAQPSATVSDKVQKLIYQALTLIDGDSLVQLLTVLDVRTQGIRTAADLLDPIKIFPNSYSTLNTLTPNGFEPIYTNGTPNTVLKTQLPAYVLRSTA